MRTRISPRLIVAALLVAVGCARGGPAPLSDADKSAIRANDQKFAQGVMAKDWAAVAAMYTTDASFMPPNDTLVKGREAIQAWMTGFPPVSAFTLEPQEVEGVGDLSYVRGTWPVKEPSRLDEPQPSHETWAEPYPSPKPIQKPFRTWGRCPHSAELPTKSRTPRGARLLRIVRI